MSIIRYGPKWRAQRRLAHAFFHEGASKQYLDIQTAANLALLRALLESPCKFMHHVRTITAKSILAAAYGIDVSAEDDPWVKLADDAMRSITAAGLPGRYAVEWLPVLKYLPAWFPGGSFQRMAHESRKLSERVLYEPLEFQQRAGKAGPSMAGSLLQNGLEGHLVPEDLIAQSTAVIYLGGSDTTVSVVTSFILCMVLHPETQAAAQAELDRVLGGRLPEFADRDTLPYVNAILLEVIRLYPVLPLGVPHRVMEDDEYGGMRIPKGTTIFPNVWAILRDETLFENPEAFMPERFLNPEKKVLDPRGPLFGFGRRVCVGRHFADNSAWLAVATVLACFRISRANDENGKDIIPNGEFVSGSITCLKPFQCEIAPRSEKARRLIVEETELDKY
ncbi:cytochrome P450 [Auricularia subglabra TFB-10046 SS5]|nr:cytochrome P450 [Auricularia subglabra TFB-10046 SS5]